ncbi:hypothetical protein V6N00_02920 [Tersicoccus sp. MR15.9]|uniref:hypothetical protein n=1 Tax=Tersicoccus mangrovi TaxID=3121635 RepID=UPI002FE5B73F
MANRNDTARLLAVATGGVAGSVLLALVVGGGIAFSVSPEPALVPRAAVSAAATTAAAASVVMGLAIGVWAVAGRRLPWLFAGILLVATVLVLAVALYGTVAGGPDAGLYLGVLFLLPAILVVGSTVLFMGLCLALPARARASVTVSASALVGVSLLSGVLALLSD